MPRRPVAALPAFCALLSLLVRTADATPGDATADHVLGQINFANSAAGLVDSRGLHDPPSIAVDRSSTPNRLYVADFDNHRVLGWKKAGAFRKGTPADLVIGQADFNSAYCNRGADTPTDKTLCFPTGLSVDPDGDLYVADHDNHRVLRFASPFNSGFTADQPAAAVFGQADFVSGLCNRNVLLGPASADTLCGPSGTAVDANGSLFIADGYSQANNNNRVLEYDDPKAAGGGTPGAPGSAGDTTADTVIGQANFTSVGCNRGTATPGANTLCGPSGLYANSSGVGVLFVADTKNNRVLQFVDPTSPGNSASVVFGQPDFTSKGSGGGLGELNGPTGVVGDAGLHLWIADAGNGRVLEYDSAPVFDTIADRAFGTAGTFPSAKRWGSPAAVDFDSTNNLFVADGMPGLAQLEGGYSRVLRLNSPLTTDAIPDGVVGQKGYVASLPNRVDVRSMSVPTGIAFDRSVVPPHVYVADRNENRVLGWANASSFVDGAPADIVLGQPSFKAHYCNRAASTAAADTLCTPTGVAVDSVGNVWVSDRDNNRVVGYDKPFLSGLTAGQAATRVIGQSDFVSSAANRGGSVTASSFAGPVGMAIDASDNLWVADYDNARVLMFKKPLTQDGVADEVLGQPDFTTGTPPPSATADVLGSPATVFVDGPGNVFVSDDRFSRVLVYQKPLATGGGTPGTPGAKGDATADRVFGQPNFTNAGCNQDDVNGTRTAQSLCSPEGLALDGSGRLWVADDGNNRVLRYDAALTGDDTADAVIGPANFTSRGTGCGGVRTAGGFCSPFGVAFDPAGNLWVADADSNRVLVFDQ